MNHKIRLADKNDSNNIIKIYEPYIKNTAISFETEVPSLSEFSNRIEKIISKYPFLVYEIDSNIAGYAYASQFRERAAFNYNVETSIYTLLEYHGKGIAYKLYDKLLKILYELGYINVYACYTVPNIKSKKFHKKFGFKETGLYKKTGYKFGQWHDLIWLHKKIRDYNNLKKISGINEIPNEIINKICEIND